MMRMMPVRSAARAELYYAKSDCGGYYVAENDLRREWGGKGADHLGLSGPPEFEQFKRLINGLDPHTGDQLTAKLVAGRIPAWDITASMPKGVTLALEGGDERIQHAMWQAGREAMAMLEDYATTRVRAGGQQADRRTRNILWYGVEHAETRPTAEDNMPDPDRHVHFVMQNLTFDEVEQKWKAVKFRPIMDLRKYFDRSFDTLLAGKLSELGYELETKWKPDGKYFSWDIKDIPQTAIAKNSRRTAEVDRTEEKILAQMEQDTGHAPEKLSAVTRDKLGATSRREKREDLTLDDCRDYWKGRLTPEEHAAIGETIQRAREGRNQKPEPRAASAMDYAMRHHFEQRSVVRWEELAATAIELSMGTASPDDLLKEALKQGVLMRMRDDRLMCTTAALQREETELAGFAAGGLGSVRPVGQDSELDRTLSNGKSLNDGQFQAVTGLLNSSNRVNLVQGPAGAGKSSMLAKFDEGLKLKGQRVTYLATTSAAVEVLKKDGFDAYTLAQFLVDKNLQADARGGRVCVDETSMMGHKDTVRLFELAKRDDLKLVLVGDEWQHGAVARGALMRVLTDYASIKPFRLREILRQHDPAYRAATTLLSEGKSVEGFDALDAMGCVQELADDERYAAIAADYLQARNENKTVLVVSPTHHEAGQITDAIRATLREAGQLGPEREFTRLVQVNASEAQKGRVEMYQPGDVIQFHQNAAGFTKGDRFTITDPAKVPVAVADKFSIYRPETTPLAVGDVIRFTGTVKTAGGQTLKNGTVRTVAAFTEAGNIRLDNDQVIRKDAGHWRPGFVETSFGSQGRTVDRVLVGMSTWSLPAINSEQLYVSASRGKESLRLYTDNKAEIRDAVAESSRQLAALDLVGRPKPPKPKPSRFEKIRKHLDRLRRRGVYESTRLGWERSGYGPPVPPRTPPIPPPTQRQHLKEERGRGR